MRVSSPPQFIKCLMNIYITEENAPEYVYSAISTPLHCPHSFHILYIGVKRLKTKIKGHDFGYSGTP